MTNINQQCDMGTEGVELINKYGDVHVGKNIYMVGDISHCIPNNIPIQIFQ